MSYFSKLWSKWFGRKPARPTSTISAFSTVGTPSVTTAAPVSSSNRPKKETKSNNATASLNQNNLYYNDSPSVIDPLTVAVAVSVLNSNDSDQVSTPSTPDQEPSSHFAPYEVPTQVEAHTHVDSGCSHHDSGSSYGDSGSSNYDSGNSYSSSYDSGSNSYDSGGGGCDSGGGLVGGD